MLAEPKNFGIIGMEMYIPKKVISLTQFVDQAELEVFDGVSAGKYTIGLGQTRMSVCDDREDINSICLSAVKSLMEKYQVTPDMVGRLEVGTETIIDKSKSVKSVLMSLFPPEFSDIEGVDTTNACYGGTNALFNCINWLESSYWDGRYAIAVAADIAVYKNGGARPTGGAGAVAILLGPNAPLVFDPIRATHIEHVYDFYKPDLHSEYPQVDGPLSTMCYTKAVDKCYNLYLEKFEQKFKIQGASLDLFDHVCLHCPYTKLVQKSFGRLAYNDFRRKTNEVYKSEELLQFAGLNLEDTYGDRVLEKAFVTFTKKAFEEKVVPTLECAKNMGNIYCGSLYAGIASLLCSVESADLQGKRVLCFSYGSGLAASMFSLTVCDSTSRIAKSLNIPARLNSRTQIAPGDYDQIMGLREQTHNMRDYAPVSAVDDNNLFPGTFYLDKVDEQFRRNYIRHE